MDRLYSRFPGGVVGFGLLLLRLTVAVWYIQTGLPLHSSGSVHSVLGFVSVSLAGPLVAGIRMSAAAIVGAGLSFALFLLGSDPKQWFLLLSLVVLSASLALLGPGGYSLDARLSGWRTIDLPSRPSSDRVGN